VCALLVPPDASGNFSVQLAYDRLHRRFIEARLMEGRSLPVLASAWRMGRSRRLASSASTPDLAAIAAAFNLEAVSTLLFQPVLTADGKPGPSFLLLTLNPSKDWNPAEQEFLALLARLLVQFLQRTREMAGLKEDIAQARQLARIAQDGAQAAQEQKQKLQGQLAVLRENSERDHRHIGELTVIAAAHEEAQAVLRRLNEENETLKSATHRLEKTLAERETQYTGDLRMALQEIVLIQSALADADQKILSLKTDPVDASPSRGQLETVVTIGKDLRQPLSSIGGYADVLLGETIGILGAKQRKYIERIKVSTERMARLLDELIQAAAPESNAGRLEFAPLDLRELIQRAAAEAQNRTALRRIALKLDLPPAPLQVHSDPHAIRKAVVQLLENAALASPEGAPVTVRLHTETGDGDQDYALIQVIDSGGGIAPGDVLRVFSPQRLSQPVVAVEAVESEGGDPGSRDTGKRTLIPGLGAHPAELQQVKILVEAIGGRTWVDSELGRGSVFSILLPVRPADATVLPGNAPSGGNGRTEAG
jgi:signal transduction histidine kinase